MDFFDQLEALNRPTVEKKPWMRGVEMVLGTVEMLDQIEQECIEAKFYGLDLETTGLDQRAFPNDQGRLETVDKIVGYCIAPTNHKGYYIPVRHRDDGAEANVPPRLVAAMIKRINEAGAVGIFFNAKFDHKFLMCEAAGETGVWDEPNTWEDVRIANYVRNSRVKRNNLKLLAKEELDREMIELDELWLQERGVKKKKDFSTLDPRWEPVVWYAAADAINTRALWEKLSPYVFEKDEYGYTSKTIYTIEKLCLTSTIWMEQNRIHIDREKLQHLIQEGQREWWECITRVYTEVSEVLERDIRPPWVEVMDKDFDPKVLSPDYTEVRATSMKNAPPDRREPVSKSVPVLTDPKLRETVEFRPSYDITIPEQFGMMLRELKVPGLVATEKSGQVKTSKDEIERVLESVGDTFPWMKSVRRFREVQKSLSNVLFNLWNDSTPERSPDGCVWANFNGLKVDTGRFSTPTPRDSEFHGQANWNVQSTKAFYYDPKDPPPVCVYRQREVISARPGHTLFAIDYSGVELRVVTNLSGEPKWLKAFFTCADCGKDFPRDTRPPPFCPDCGSDKIGDLHSETAVGVLGADKNGDPKVFKMHRQTAKIVNFLLCYGGSGNAVSRSTGKDEEEGWRIKNNFDKTYKGLLKWWKFQEKDVARQKYVRTAYGRKYYCPDIDHELSTFRSKAKRNAVNGPVQGTSADIMKFAMGLLYREFRKRGWLDKVLMTITIHDELVFEILNEIMGEAVPVIEEIMCFQAVKNLGWAVPLKVDIEFGPNWTVPKNLTEMTWDKTCTKWTSEMVRYFPEQYRNFLAIGGTPVGDAPPPEPSVPAPSTSSTPPAPYKAPTPALSMTTPTVSASAEKIGGAFIHRVPLFRMSAENAEKLARLIYRCKDRGTDPLQVVDEEGNDLLGGQVNVNFTEFKILASYEGV